MQLDQARLSPVQQKRLGLAACYALRALVTANVDVFLPSFECRC